MTEPRYLPRSIARRVHADLIDEICDGMAALAGELAPLAHRDLGRFEREWDRAAERIIRSAAERAHKKARAWSATRAHWGAEQ